MKKAVWISVMLSALAGATPVAAHEWDRDRDGWGRGYGNRYYAGACDGSRARRLEARIYREAQEGDISRRTARRLHKDVDRVERFQQRRCSYGLSGWEARDIDERFDRIEYRLRNEAGDRWRTWRD